MGLFGGSNESVTKIRVVYDGKEAQRGLMGLYNTVKLVFGAWIVKQIFNFTKELAEVGVQAEIVEKNFNNFAVSVGKNSGKMMNELRNATLGTVSDIRLQQSAMKSMISGIKFDDIITAMEYVSKYAIATGDDVDTRMRTVMLGLARGSARLVDDVGIMVSEGKDMINNTMIQMKEKMGNFAISTDDAALKISKMKSEIANLKAEIGTELIDEFVTMNVWMLKVAKVGTSILTDSLHNLAQTWKMIKGESREVIEAEETVRYAKGIEDTARAQAYIIDVTGKQRKEVETLKGQYMALVNSLGNYQKAMKSASPMDRAGAALGISAVRDDIETVGKALTLAEKKLELYKKAQKEIVGGAGGGDITDSGPSAEEIEAAEKLVQKAREDVLKESLNGRLELLNEQYEKEKEIAIAGSMETAFIDKAYAIKKSKIIEDYNNELKQNEEKRLSKFRENLDKEVALLKKVEEEKAKARAGSRLTPQFQDEAMSASQRLIDNMRDARQRMTELEEAAITDQDELIDLRAQKEIDYWEARLGRTKAFLELEKQIRENAAIEKLDIEKRDYNAELEVASQFTNVLQSFSNRAADRELKNLDRKKMGEKRYNKERERILKEQEEQERKFARVQQAIILGETIMDIAKGSGTALKEGFFGIPEFVFVGAQGALQIAAIQAQHFQRGYLGTPSLDRKPDDMNAMIGKNEAVVPGPQYAMHADDVRAIVNNTANTAAGLRSLRGGSVVHNYYGLSSEQVIAVQRDAERRKYTGRLI